MLAITLSVFVCPLQWVLGLMNTTMAEFKKTYNQ